MDVRTVNFYPKTSIMTTLNKGAKITTCLILPLALLKCKRCCKIHSNFIILQRCNCPYFPCAKEDESTQATKRLQGEGEMGKPELETGAERASSLQNNCEMRSHVLELGYDSCDRDYSSTFI
jgi:hypothetical protein